MTWNLKDTLPARKAVYYGKVIAGRPSFIALELLPAFLRLRVAPGGYRKLYERGALSHCGKLVMDALTRRGAAETKALKLASGYAQPGKRAVFDRAMKELQEKFLALKIEERYDPFTYVWDTVDNRWGEATREARSLNPGEAAYRIVRRYFEIAAYGNERAIARILGIDPALVERALRRLERERTIRRGVRIGSLREAISMLAALGWKASLTNRLPSRLFGPSATDGCDTTTVRNAPRAARSPRLAASRAALSRPCRRRRYKSDGCDRNRH